MSCPVEIISLILNPATHMIRLEIASSTQPLVRTVRAVRVEITHPGGKVCISEMLNKIVLFYSEMYPMK